MEARDLGKEGALLENESYTTKLLQEWGPLLEGIPQRTDAERYLRKSMAVLFENERAHLKQLSEEMRAVNVGSFTKFIFPLLRRTFPNLIANEIVSVQPMTAPIGAVFFLDYIYGSNKGGTAKGNVFPRDFDRDYSSEFVNGEMLATGNGVAFGGAGTVLSATLAWNPVRPLDSSRGFSVVIKEVNSSDVVIQDAVDNGTGGFTGDVTAGTINYSNGAIAGFLFTNPPASGNRIIAEYYFDGELNSQMPEWHLDVKKAAVEAKSRRSKALWSAEASEDLRAFHGAEAETELVSAIAQEFSLEIDRDVINQLFLASTSTTGSFDRVVPAGSSEIDHLRAMVTEIATVSALIYRKSLRAPANWIVTSPEISALLAQLTTHGDYRPLWVPGMDSHMGPVDMIRPGGMPHGQGAIYKAGTLMNKWVVYEDPFFTRDFMMIGLKGPSYLDSGFVFAPYIPVQLTPTFLDPNDWSFRKAIRTRYATKLLRQEFFGQLRVLNL